MSLKAVPAVAAIHCLHPEVVQDGALDRRAGRGWPAAGRRETTAVRNLTVDGRSIMGVTMNLTR